MTTPAMLGVAAAALLVGTALLRWRRYVARATTCGWLSSPPSQHPVAVWCARAIARVLTFVQVGRVRVTGADYLKQPGPCIIASNHPHYADAAVVPLLVDGPARYFTARGVLRFCFGLGALLLAPAGAVCVDLRQGKSRPALRAGVRILTSGQRLVVFPEGWAHVDGATAPFKRGVAWMAREASGILRQPISVVPVFLRYGRYPGSRIKALNPRLQYLLLLLGFWYYRRGVTVVVGAPIPVTATSSDSRTATELLRNHILSLDPAPTP